MTLKTLPDLFLRCRGRKTGHWRVGSEFSRTVYLDSGDIVFASSNFPSDRLTTILVEHGKLTKDQMSHAMTNLKPGISVGKNLIEMGFITQRDLLDVARLQVEQIVYSALMLPETPTFNDKDELEETIVRLPLDTPALLFASVMKITDHDALLELLGALNQVVLLQGKRVFDLDLPNDLQKMARLMDGTHTIRELSNETAVEPMRTGAFALFLREIGWGKLFELPPLDRQAITKALDPPDPTMPPASIPPERSQLFRVIEEAAMPTTNLEHLSSMLDELTNNAEGNDSLDEPPSPPSRVPDPPQTPQSPIHEEFAQLPLTPQKSGGRILPFTEPYPLEPLEGTVQAEPSIKISQGNLDEDEVPEISRTLSNANPKPSKRAGKKSSSTLMFLLLLALILAAAAYSIWKLKNREPHAPFTVDIDPSDYPSTDEPDLNQPPSEERSNPTPTESTQPAPLPTGGTHEDIEAVMPPPVVAPQPSTPSRPPVETRSDVSSEARFRALADGNITMALEQGKAHYEAMPKTGWTVRLIMACQSESLQNCAHALGPMRPDFFLMPYRLRNGSNCYNLFVGRYSSRNTAEAEIKKMMDAFQGKFRVEPETRQISEIKTVQ
jgi:hypothetical protein